jgi:4-hydroxybutyryl-CoA dehydratase / vinylacetyl-CoA-Delta-isomerase
MALKSPEAYRQSLRDGRTIYYRGERVADLNVHPELRIAVELGALDYAMGHDPELRLRTVARDPETAEEMSAFYRIPRSPEDLLERAALIDLFTERGWTIPPLIKEIGTDALFALMRILDGEELERAKVFYRHCWRGDLALAVAQTDSKGDRSKPPHAQTDPDLYLHVVDQQSGGIVVRGVKLHTSASANSHELIVLPTRAMGPEDADYAVAFSVPVNANGLRICLSPFFGGARNSFEHPLSSKTKMLESITVFDDVFVPWERVFLYRKPEIAGPLAIAFVDYHRFTAVSYKLPLLDAFVGAAATIAEMNGVAKAGHIRDKLAQLITYAETVRGLTQLAALRGRVDERGIAYPDPMTTNMAKYTFATRYHQAAALVQECAGGLLVTGPGQEDWESTELRPILEKYLAAKAPAAARVKMINLIADMTVRDFGGYHAVLAIHAEGSVEAEKMQVLRTYDPRQALARARKFAGID